MTPHGCLCRRWSVADHRLGNAFGPLENILEENNKGDQRTRPHTLDDLFMRMIWLVQYVYSRLLVNLISADVTESSTVYKCNEESNKVGYFLEIFCECDITGVLSILLFDAMTLKCTCAIYFDIFIFVLGKVGK